MPSGKAMANILLSHVPEVVCITEGHLDQLPDGWHVCASEADHGYRPILERRRKVLLFSRNPWKNVDIVGDHELPPGRFVAAATDTSIGPVRFVGVCIPWKDAHVRTGSCNRQPWEDHKAYLTRLRMVLADAVSKTVLLGDFNQRIPRRWQPEDVSNLLADTLGQNFEVLTSGVVPIVNEHSIDHVACTRDLRMKGLSGLPNVVDGLTLSDHFGLMADVEAA